jgi:hypothetical protein
MLKLTPDIVRWVHACGPLHVMVGRLPKIGYVPVALTNATSVPVDCHAWQEWAPDGRIVTLKLIIPAYIDAPTLANPRPDVLRLPASTTAEV